MRLKCNGKTKISELQHFGLIPELKKEEYGTEGDEFRHDYCGDYKAKPLIKGCVGRLMDTESLVKDFNALCKDRSYC